LQDPFSKDIVLLSVPLPKTFCESFGGLGIKNEYASANNELKLYKEKSTKNLMLLYPDISET